MSLTAWKRYLEDPESVDEDQFDTLLTVDQVDPSLAFKSLPHGKTLAEKTKKFQQQTQFDGTYYRPRSENRTSKKKLEALALAQAAQYADYFRSSGRIKDAESLEGLAVKTTSSREDFKQKTRPGDQNVSDHLIDISDDLIDAYFEVDARFSGVMETLLHLTMEPGVARHIIASTIKFPVDFRPSYDAYIGGGSFVIMNDHILVFSPMDS